jgi:hypothetical protein
MNLINYPFASIAAVTLGVLSLTLGVSAFIYLTSKRVTRRLIRIFFPRHHTLYELAMTEISDQDLFGLRR